MIKARKSDIITVTSATTIIRRRIETSNKTKVKLNTLTILNNNNREDVVAVVVVVVAVVDIAREAAMMMVATEIINKTKKGKEEAEAVVETVVKVVEAEGNALINKIVVVSSKGRHPETTLSISRKLKRKPASKVPKKAKVDLKIRVVGSTRSNQMSAQRALAQLIQPIGFKCSRKSELRLMYINNL